MPIDTITSLVNLFLLDVVFPSFCCQCGKIISKSDAGVCVSCHHILDSYVTNYNKDYIFEIEEKIHGSRKWYVDDGVWAFNYNSHVSQLMYSMKFKNNKSLAILLARYLINAVSSMSWQFDAVTFIPITKNRMWSRGFNQSQLMARYIAKGLNKDLIETLYIKNDDIAQKKLSSNERFIHTYQKFDILPDCTNMDSNAILIVDDVYTTGATINECARILKMNGVNCVYVSIAAYAMLKDTMINN